MSNLAKRLRASSNHDVKSTIKPMTALKETINIQISFDHQFDK